MYVCIYIYIYLYLYFCLCLYLYLYLYLCLYLYLYLHLYLYLYMCIYRERERCTCTYVSSSNFSVVEALGIAIRHVQIKSSMKQIEPLLHSNFDIFFDMGHGPQVQFVQRFRMKEDPKLTDFTNTKHTKSGTPTPHRDPFYIYCVWLK